MECVHDILAGFACAGFIVHHDDGFGRPYGVIDRFIVWQIDEVRAGVAVVFAKRGKKRGILGVASRIK